MEDSADTPAVRDRRRHADRARRSRPARPKGSPLLLILMTIVVLPSVLLADAWGAGAAGIIGGLTGMFSLVVFIGGPLRPDLLVIALMGPLLVIAAAVPRIVAEASRPAAIALVVILTFIAALLPLIGTRFANAGMGLGMTTMFGYGYAPQGGADHAQVLAAAIAGVAVAVLLRVLMGIGDPSKPTRTQVAAVLTADDPAAATATAFGTWLSDRRSRWLADVLEGASRYRIALRTAELAGVADTAPLRARAADLAARIAAKANAKGKTTGPGDAGSAARASTPAVDAASATASPAPTGRAAAALEDASRALDAVETAASRRDTTPVELDRDRRRQLRDAVLHPSARLTSIQVRHAFRTALAVLIMLIITSWLERGDPLVSTVLLTTFSIMQASWNDTATKTRNKVIGLTGGSLTVAVVLLVVPSRFLVAVAAVALCLGLWYIITRPALGAGFMVIVSVGFNAVTRDLDPVTLLVQYVALTVAAVVVGVLLGFTVIPGFRPPPLRERISRAVDATIATLQPSSPGGAPGARPRTEDIALLRDAGRMQDELVPDRDDLDDRQRQELDTLRTALRDLTTLAGATTLTPDDIDDLVAALRPGDDARPTGETSLDIDEADAADDSDLDAASWVMRQIAQQAGEAERALLGSLTAKR